VHLLETHFNTPELLVDLGHINRALAARPTEIDEGFGGTVMSRNLTTRHLDA
jgi:hypothetical protein